MSMTRVPAQGVYAFVRRHVRGNEMPTVELHPFYNPARNMLTMELRDLSLAEATGRKRTSLTQH